MHTPLRSRTNTPTTVHTVLLTVTRVLLALFLLAGFLVVMGQVIALALGDRELMELSGTSMTDAACVIAGGAGICSFLLLYTHAGRNGGTMECPYAAEEADS
ncbi:hypothetical protein [Streptomyces sp. NPDC017529]|uniref:hypothetical protein n=1 Tax=Streptomyces sp. NPDC017529 TaxID=3365000 RepID=UPI0037A322FE